MTHITRRSLLAGGAALLAAGAWMSPAAAQFGRQAPSYSTFSSVDVDVTPLQASQVGPAADLLRQALVPAARRALAGHLGPGPRLVIRLTGLSLNSGFAGAGRPARGGFGGSLDTDYLEGEILVVGRRGEILARYPQLSAIPASSGGAWNDPDSERRRVIGIAQHYAGWLKYSIGL